MKSLLFRDAANKGIIIINTTIIAIFIIILLLLLMEGHFNKLTWCASSVTTRRTGES